MAAKIFLPVWPYFNDKSNTISIETGQRSWKRKIMLINGSSFTQVNKGFNEKQTVSFLPHPLLTQLNV